MSQIKVIQGVQQLVTTVTGPIFGAPISIVNSLTLSAQINVTGVSTPGTAAAVLQVSNDPEGATPTIFNDYGSSQVISATGPLFFEKVNPSGIWARLKFTIASGNFSASSQIVSKGIG